MPNIPNTSQPGQSLFSAGNGTNASYWGDGSILGNSAQMTLEAQVFNRYTGEEQLNDSRYLPLASGGNTSATVSGVGWAGPIFSGLYPVAVIFGVFANLDATATYTINGEVDVVQIGGTNGLQRTFSETLVLGATYNLSYGDWTSGSLNTNGTDLSEVNLSGNYTIESTAGLQYAVVVVLEIISS